MAFGKQFNATHDNSGHNWPFEESPRKTHPGPAVWSCLFVAGFDLVFLRHRYPVLSTLSDRVKLNVHLSSSLSQLSKLTSDYAVSGPKFQPGDPQIS